MKLLTRDRRRGHVAAARSGGVEGQRPPAGPDLEQMVIRPEVELLAHPLELCDLGLFQGHLAVLEHSAGVAERRIEHPFEQVGAEVVVRGDVAAPTRPGAAPHDRPDHPDRHRQQRQPRASAIQAGGVQRAEPDQRNQIRRVPQVPARKRPRGHATRAGPASAKREDRASGRPRSVGRFQTGAASRARPRSGSRRRCGEGSGMRSAG